MEGARATFVKRLKERRLQSKYKRVLNEKTVFQFEFSTGEDLKFLLKCNHKPDKWIEIKLNYKRGRPKLLNIEPAIHKLPAIVENFVGRNHEWKTVIEMINNSRYVSIEGSQGIGKSAIVKQVANILYDRKSDI